MPRACTPRTDGDRGVLDGGERIGTGIHGLTHSHLFPVTGFFTVRLAGDSIPRGGCIEPRSTVTAPCSILTTIISAQTTGPGGRALITREARNTREAFTMVQVRRVPTIPVLE